MTMQPMDNQRFVFPPWTNALPPLSLAAVTMGLIGTIFGIWYYFSPRHTDVGYQPEQPIPYSHKLHAGEMGMDCRYCHVGVEKSAVASVPPTQVCMNCHAQVKKDSPKLQALRDSWATGNPVPWVKVHKSPDYVYFNHARHVTRGVGCVECHGRIDQMVTVKQVQPLSMGWCLECHRDPASHLRPVDKITTMDWAPPSGETAESFGQKIVSEKQIAPPTDCSRCHR
jgi:hypothetical protein